MKWIKSLKGSSSAQQDTHAGSMLSRCLAKDDRDRRRDRDRDRDRDGDRDRDRDRDHDRSGWYMSARRSLLNASTQSLSIRHEGVHMLDIP